jgi:hypothetical protein
MPASQAGRRGSRLDEPAGRRRSARPRRGGGRRHLGDIGSALRPPRASWWIVAGLSFAIVILGLATTCPVG